MCALLCGRSAWHRLRTANTARNVHGAKLASAALHRAHSKANHASAVGPITALSLHAPMQRCLCIQLRKIMATRLHFLWWSSNVNLKQPEGGNQIATAKWLASDRLGSHLRNPCSRAGRFPPGCRRVVQAQKHESDRSTLTCCGSRCALLSCCVDAVRGCSLHVIAGPSQPHRAPPTARGSRSSARSCNGPRKEKMVPKTRASFRWNATRRDQEPRPAQVTMAWPCC